MFIDKDFLVFCFMQTILIAIFWPYYKKAFGVGVHLLNSSDEIKLVPMYNAVVKSVRSTIHVVSTTYLSLFCFNVTIHPLLIPFLSILSVLSLCASGFLWMLNVIPIYLTLIFFVFVYCVIVSLFSDDSGRQIAHVGLLFKVPVYSFLSFFSLYSYVLVNKLPSFYVSDYIDFSNKYRLFVFNPKSLYFMFSHSFSSAYLFSLSLDQPRDVVSVVCSFFSFDIPSSWKGWVFSCWVVVVVQHLFTETFSFCFFCDQIFRYIPIRYTTPASIACFFIPVFLTHVSVTPLFVDMGFDLPVFVRWLSLFVLFTYVVAVLLTFFLFHHYAKEQQVPIYPTCDSLDTNHYADLAFESASDDPDVVILSLPLFQSGTHRGKSLDDRLRSVNIGSAEVLMRSIARCDNTSHSDDRDMKNLVRDCRFILSQFSAHSFYTNNSLVTKTQDVVQDIFDKYSYLFDSTQFDTDSHFFVKFDPIPPTFFTDHVSRRGSVTEALVTTSCRQELSLGNFVSRSQATKPRSLMHMQVLKSICASMIEEGHASDIILSNISRKCPLKSRSLDDLTWMAPFIPQSWYSFGCRDSDRMVSFLLKMGQRLREKLLIFTRIYVNFYQLDATSRRRLKDARESMISDLYKSPSVQMAWITHSAEEAQHVLFKQFADRLMFLEVPGVDFLTVVRVRKVERHRAIMRSRDEKYVSFESYSYVSANSIYFSVLFLQFVGIVYYLSVAQPFFRDMASKARSLATSAYSMAVSANNISESMETVNDIVDGFNKRFDALSSISGGTILTPEEKNLLLELKSLIHGVSYLYEGKKKDAMNWFANYAITRPEHIRDAILSLNTSDLMNAISTYAVVKIGSGVYKVSKDTFTTACSLFERTGSVDDLTRSGMATVVRPPGAPTNVDEPQDVEDIALEADSSSFSLLPVLRILSTHFADKMSSDDIRVANNQFVFVNHRAKQLGDYATTLSEVISVFCRTLFSFDPFCEAYQAMAYDALSKVDKMQQFIKTFEIDPKILYTKAIAVESLSSLDGMHSFNSSLSFQTLPGQIQRLYSTNLVRYKEIVYGIANSVGQPLERYTPLCVVMLGAPGSGKSSAINSFIQFLQVMKGETVTSDMIYTHNPNSVYFEGYHNQKFVKIDEAFNDRSNTGRVELAKLILSMINREKMALNMAFESKGKMYFDSEYIFMTTNIGDQSYASGAWDLGLTDINAFHRRMHIALHRSDKYTSDVAKQVFRVEHNIYLPEYNGKYLTVPELTYMIDATRREMLRLESLTTITDAQALEILRTYFPQPESDNMSYAKFFALLLKVTKDQIVDPSMYKWYAGAFGVLCAAAAAGVVYKFMNSVSSESDAEIKARFYDHVTFGKDHAARNRDKHRAAQGGSYGKQRKSGVTKVTYGGKEYSVRGKHGGGRAESSSDNYNQVVLESIRKGIGMLRVRNLSGSMTERSTCVHYQNGCIITCAHTFRRFIDENGDMEPIVATIEFGSVSIDTFSPMVDFVVDDNDVILDIAWFNLPEGRLPASMQGYFAPLSANIPPKTTLSLLYVDERNNMISLQALTLTDRASLTYSGYLVDQPFTYTAQTVQGSSGGLLIHSSYDGKQYIVGMHCAGAGSGPYKKGYALPISKALITTLMQHANDELPQAESDGFPLVVDRYVTNDLKHDIPRSCSLIPSSMIGSLGPVHKIPAKLRPFESEDGTIIDPLNIALLKLRQDDPPCIMGDTDTAIHEYLNIYPPDNGRILTWEESINGIPSIGLQAIVLNTSPGYPFNLSHSKGKSKYIFRSEVTGKLEYEPSFLKRLLELDGSIRRGERIPCLWADLLKVETRKPEKVALGKTRLMSASPLDFLILFRRYFGFFMAYKQQFACTKPVTVGINAHSREWQTMHDVLEALEGVVIAGDFTEFDGSLPTDVIRDFYLEMNNRWYSESAYNANIEVENLARRTLCKDIYHAIHICDNKIYSVRRGNPSGNSGTVHINSDCCWYMTHIILVHDFGLSPKDFIIFCNGDDNLIKVRGVKLKASDLAPHYARRFGMRYTNFTKDGTDEYYSIYDIRYLSRSFVLDKDVIRAPLPEETLMDMFNYKQKSMSNEDFIRAVIMSYNCEAVHFGKEVFHRKMVDLRSAIISRMGSAFYDSIVPMLKNWKDLNHSMYVTNEIVGFTPHSVSRSSPSPVSFESFSGASGEIKRITSNLYPITDINQHTEHTDKAIILPSTTETVQLGEYQDVAAVASTLVQTPYQPIHDVTNFEHFNMDQTLKREFALPTITWDTGVATNTVLSTMDFPQALLSKTYIFDKLKNFKYLRAGIRISFRLSSNSFLYGRLLAMWSPDFTATEDPDFTLQRHTGYPHVLLDATSSSVVTMDIPFIHPKRFVNLRSYVADEIAKVKVVVLHPLTSSTEASGSCLVMISASFIEPQVSYPIPESAAEGKVKSTADCISSSMEISISASASVKNLPNVTRYRGQMRKFGSSLLSALGVKGLGKPTIAQAPYLYNQTADLNYASGLSTATRLSPKVDDYISCQNIVGGSTMDEMKFSSILGTPQMTRSIGLIATSGDFLVGNIGPYGDVDPICDLFAQRFRYWSGSYLFKLYISASVTHAVRVVFYLTSNATGTGPSVWEDSYHRVVDIQGSTEVDIMIPYMEPEFMAPTVPGSVSMSLRAKVLTWSQPTALNTPIYMTCYKACGSDFKLYGQIDGVVLPESCPRDDFSRDFPPLHPSMTGYSCTKLTTGEDMEDVRECIHRYAPATIGQATATAFSLPVYGSEADNVIRGPEIWGTFYKYWRGSARYKFVSKSYNSNPSLTEMAYYLQGSTGMIGAVFSNATQPVLDVEIPYMSDLVYRNIPIVPSTPSVERVFVTGKQRKVALKSFGDDFSYHFIRPPRGLFIPGGSGEGYQAVATWLNS